MMEITKEDECREFNEIVKIIKENPHDGLELLYNKYKTFINLTALYYCKSHEMADKIVCDLFINLWKYRKRLCATRNPKRLLRKIIKNLAIDEFRRNKKEQALTEDLPAKTDQYQEFLDKSVYFSLIERLTPTEQNIINDKLLLDLTFQDIAKRRGKPTSTISTTYYRALEKLKIYIEKNNKI